MVLKNKTIGIIGTGRVGCAIGYGLSRSRRIKCQIIANDRVKRQVRRFYQLLNLKYQARSVCEIAQLADIIFITTNDSAIKNVYQTIYPHLKSNQVVVHCSGVYSNAILEKPKSAKDKRILKIGLWPIQTFPTQKSEVAMLRNCYYVVEAQGKAKEIGKEIVNALHGQAIFVAEKDKALYHIIGVFVSNYLVALLSVVNDLAQYLKIKPAKLLRLFMPIINQTLKNIYKTGVKKSLSGPIIRGDIETIKLHLKMLSKKMPKLLPIYRVLGLKTLELIKNQPAVIKTIKSLFESK